MSIVEQIFDAHRRVVALQGEQVRKYALQLLGEDVGDPSELMRRLQARIREMAGPNASLVWCVVEQHALDPGVAHESYLAIDAGGGEGTRPVRIGPVLRIGNGVTVPPLG
jgi:hypothetical protein